MSDSWTELDERPAQRQAWEEHARQHFAKYPRGEKKYEPMSPREAFLAGWRDRAEWGYQGVRDGGAS